MSASVEAEAKKLEFDPMKQAPKAETTMRFAVLSVSPETAQRWLARNRGNRPMRRSRVEAIARDLAAGRWHANGETVKFSVSGNLLDGQHRLTAIAEGGLTVEVLVVWDVPDAAFATLGDQISRTRGDILHADGFANANTLAATAELLIGLRDGNPRRVRTRSKGEILEFVRARPGLVESVSFAGSRRTPLLTPSVVGTARYVFEKAEDAETADLFLGEVIDGTGLHEGDATWCLRKRLERNLAAKAKLDSRYLLGLLIKAWNAWLGGRAVRAIGLKEGEFPDVEGRNFNRKEDSA